MSLAAEVKREASLFEDGKRMTTNEAFEWSQLPPSKYGAWVSTILSDETDKLKRLHVICKWRDVADTEFEEFKTQRDQKRSPAWNEYGYDPVQDEAFMSLEPE